MGIISSLFQSESTINKVVDAVVDTGDAIFLTDEEKLKYGNIKQKLKIEMLKAYQPFKIAQRFLALIFCVPFVLIHIFSVALYASGYTAKAVEIITLNNDALGTIVLGVVLFYFGGGSIEGIIERRFKK